MDESFFIKHLIEIKKRKNNKEEILLHIKEKTGLELHEAMFSLSKKEITLNVSSVMKQKLYQKNIVAVVGEKGFTLKK